MCGLAKSSLHPHQLPNRNAKACGSQRSLKIPLTRQAVQTAAVGLDVIQVTQPVLAPPLFHELRLSRTNDLFSERHQQRLLIFVFEWWQHPGIPQEVSKHAVLVLRRR